MKTGAKIVKFFISGSFSLCSFPLSSQRLLAFSQLCGSYEKSLIGSILSLRKDKLILPFYVTYWKRQAIRACSLSMALHLLMQFI
jgi:hypothetical protein